jgi:hypothetical protein
MIMLSCRQKLYNGETYFVEGGRGSSCISPKRTKHHYLPSTGIRFSVFLLYEQWERYFDTQEAGKNQSGRIGYFKWWREQ